VVEEGIEGWRKGGSDKRRGRKEERQEWKREVVLRGGDGQ
jgi:hypothetical protein